MFVNSLTFVTFIVVHDSFFLHGIYVCMSFHVCFHISLSFYYDVLLFKYILYSWMAPISLHVSSFINFIIPLSFFLYPIYYIYFCTRCFCFEFQITSFLKLCNGNHMPAAVCHNIGSQVFIIVCI